VPVQKFVAFRDGLLDGRHAENKNSSGTNLKLVRDDELQIRGTRPCSREANLLYPKLASNFIGLESQSDPS